jgi:hypothetical protein
MAIVGDMALTYGLWSVSSPDPLSFLLNPVIWALVGFPVGIYAFIRGFFLLRRKRFIQNVPRSTIRGAPLGLIQVAGKVEGPYTIIGPLSEEDCLYYRAVVWSKGERSPWRKAAEESLAAPFFLNDGTGKMMVDPRGAETELPPVFSEEYQTDIPDHLRHFLSRHAVPSGLALKLEEYCVRPGDTLFAMGTLRENSRSGAGSSPGEFLSPEAADLERRGEMEADWPGAAVAPQTNVARISKPSIEFDLHPPVVLAGSGNRPLFISSCSRSEIVETLGLRSALYIWGGPILSLICFWYLLSRLGYL